MRCSALWWLPFRWAAITNRTWEEMFMFSLKRKPTHCCKREYSVWMGLMLLCMSREEQCKEALIKFNGRWYAGRQLHCEMCPVTRWKNAICGQQLLFHHICAYGDVHALAFTSVHMLLCSSPQVCLTDRSALKGSTAISCTCFEIPGKNSGRPTETCTCPQTAVWEAAIETDATPSAMATAGSGAAAEAHRDPRDLAADEMATGGGAGVKTRRCPTFSERTDHLDPDTATGGTTGIGAGVEAETGRRTGWGERVQMGTGIEVKKDTAAGKKEKRAVKRGKSPEARAETGKEASRAENGAPRNAASMRTMVTLRPEHGSATNGPKRARKRVKSIKSEAVRQTQWLLLQSQTLKKSLRDGGKVWVRRVPARRPTTQRCCRIPARWTVMMTATLSALSDKANFLTQN